MLEASRYCEVDASAYCVVQALLVEQGKWIDRADYLWLFQEQLQFEPRHSTLVLEDDTNLDPGPAIVDVLVAVVVREAESQS